MFNVKAGISYAFELQGFDTLKKSKNEVGIYSQFSTDDKLPKSKLKWKIC